MTPPRKTTPCSKGCSEQSRDDVRRYTARIVRRHLDDLAQDNGASHTPIEKSLFILVDLGQDLGLLDEVIVRLEGRGIFELYGHDHVVVEVALAADENSRRSRPVSSRVGAARGLGAVDVSLRVSDREVGANELPEHGQVGAGVVVSELLRGYP